MINGCYETGLIEWKNGSITNAEGENEGSAHVLSFAALAGLDKEKVSVFSKGTERVLFFVFFLNWREHLQVANVLLSSAHAVVADSRFMGAVLQGRFGHAGGGRSWEY